MDFMKLEKYLTGNTSEVVKERDVRTQAIKDERNYRSAMLTKANEDYQQACRMGDKTRASIAKSNMNMYL